VDTTRKRISYGIGVPVFLVASLITAWFGFCWAGWFGSSALIQHIVQCRCPSHSEQARYTPFIVLASACRKPALESVSPDSRWLTYREKINPGRLMLVDLKTLQEHELLLDPSIVGGLRFIRPTLLLISIYQPGLPRSFVLYDTTTNQRITLPTVPSWRKLLSDDTLARMRDAEMVFVTVDSIIILGDKQHGSFDTSLALDAEGAWWLSELRTQLDQLQIHYELDPIFQYPTITTDIMLSADSRLGATKDGIIQRSTGALVSPIGSRLAGLAPPFEARYWALNDQAVVYTRPQTTVAGLGMWASIAEDWLVVPQPLLLLQVKQ